MLKKKVIRIIKLWNSLQIRKNKSGAEQAGSSGSDNLICFIFGLMWSEVLNKTNYDATYEAFHVCVEPAVSKIKPT